MFYFTDGEKNRKGGREPSEERKNMQLDLHSKKNGIVGKNGSGRDRESIENERKGQKGK
jgi:hypothetical protein